MKNIYFLLPVLFFLSCRSQTKTYKQPKNPEISAGNPALYDTTINTIHVLVALCDNTYQGIVKVPAGIGNGQDPDNNLYWGCGGGVRTYFKNSKSWTLVKHYFIDSIKLERVVFKNKTKNLYLIADAYNGKCIRECTTDFLKSCSGQMKDTVTVNGKTLGVFGNSKVVCYIGHNGLMDFSLTETFNNTDNKKRDAIILACISKSYFSAYLAAAKANPLVWSTGLMSPEAYTLHDALKSYMNNESSLTVRTSAAKAYAKYQKCSEKAAWNLIVTGW